MKSSVPSSAQRIAKPVAKFLTIQALSYLGYLVLSPIVVFYGALLLMLLAFVFMGGFAVSEEIMNQLIRQLAYLEQQYGWVDWVYREELGFKGNILRLFGWVSLLWYLAAAGISALRTNPPEPSLKRTIVWWGGFNALIAVALSIGLISIEIATGGGAVSTGIEAGGDSIVLRGLQFTVIVSIMMGLMFGTSLVPVLISHVLGRAGDWVRAEW